MTTIWEAELFDKRVIVRDARPPDNGNWESLEGLKILSAIRREVVTQIRLQHPNILSVLGVSKSHAYPLSIITPLADNGCALEYLHNLTSRLRPTATHFEQIVEIASALSYMHALSPPVIHGDLHGRNILVDGRGHGLLCDFGLSRIKHEQTRIGTGILAGGVDRFTSPELLSLKGNSKWRTTHSSDCYGFAMTILQLVTLQKPFAEFEQSFQASQAATRGKRPKRPAAEVLGLSVKTADQLWSLLKDMWHQNPVKRPDMHIVWRSLVDMSPNT
ncbi:kinase-like protein [Clavulina sp. PMI_390]|nr:kinase-like protein [Clavulina sp. PMI_390]